MKKSSYSFVFASASLLVVLLVAGFNYYVDPFTYYHQPWTPINFSKMHRFSNPGLARQFDYEAVVLGTSHVMELKSSRFSEIIGRPGLNLATNGSSFRSQAELAELVLHQGKARTIFWEMNFPSFSLGDVVSILGEQYPAYFYQPGVETPFRYLLSFDTLVQSRKALQQPGSITIDNRNDAVVREFSRQRVLDSWAYEIQIWNADVIRYWADIQKTVETPEQVLQTRLLPLLRQHPNVNFKLFLPPHSLLFFLLHEGMGSDDFDKWLEFRNALARLIEDFPNAELYDFQLDWLTAENFDLFRDLEHYNSDVLEEIFVRVSQQNKPVSKAEVMKNSRQIDDRVITFGLEFCSEEPERCSQTLKQRLQVKSHRLP